MKVRKKNNLLFFRLLSLLEHFPRTIEYSVDIHDMIIKNIHHEEDEHGSLEMKLSMKVKGSQSHTINILK